MAMAKRSIPTVLRNLSSLSSSPGISKPRPEIDCEKAGNLFKSVSASFNSSSPFANKITVRHLARSLRFADIESLIESHKLDSRIKEEPFICTLIRSYGLVGMFNHALQTYEEMDNLGTPRSTLSLNALLIACNQSRNYERVHNLFYEMQNRFTITPNEGTYQALIKSYCALGDIERGMKMIRELENKGIEVSGRTYSTVLKYLYKEKIIDEAEQLWIEMVYRKVELDVYAYNVRIMYASDAGDLESMKELVTQMESSGLKPNAATINYLFNAYFKSGTVEEIKMLYDGLERSGHRPNSITMRNLVRFFCRKGDYASSFLVLTKIIEYQILPGFNTLENLLRGLVATNRLKEANMMTKLIWKKFSPCSLKSWDELLKRLRLPTVDEMLNTTKR